MIKYFLSFRKFQLDIICDGFSFARLRFYIQSIIFFTDFFFFFQLMKFVKYLKQLKSAESSKCVLRTDSISIVLTDFLIRSRGYFITWSPKILKKKTERLQQTTLDHKSMKMIVFTGTLSHTSSFIMQKVGNFNGNDNKKKLIHSKDLDKISLPLKLLLANTNKIISHFCLMQIPKETVKKTLEYI
ncbi:hypothetical protein RFI_02664 [Reticulomyxa filosa]|uniref:Uncharacterized protein n=1 Tax=Reticulomyxa filosa TaxID=46433 RepID=X6P8C4_RETFI|nr:hypothetical protein RFI_02664 [Reticulomyxa filosa]|eukprot:ETO34431.1 hypothetical protein RFI_02664 [Reticulomyxa filosa]